MKRVLIWAISVITVGCAGSALQSRAVQHVDRGEYAAALQVYEREGRSDSVLSALCEALLLQAARSPDEAQQRAAFSELSGLGRRADGLLERLADEAQPELIRAEALRIQTSLGDSGARSSLRALLGSRDADVVDRAYASLDPDDDWPVLESALHEARPMRRRTALFLLQRSQRDHIATLQEVSRLDPEPPLRAAALSALERYGSAALPAFEAALGDPDESVRVAAIEGLARAAAAPEARNLLDRELGAGGNVESVAAAKVLLRMKPPQEPERAWAAMLAALSALDPALRARAATSLTGVPLDADDRKQLHARLHDERAASVKLVLALLLGRDDPEARAVFSALSESASLTGAEAAAELAPRDDKAHARLKALRKHDSPLVRATVARLLARELHDHAAALDLLADASWQVRIAAAAAVLHDL